MFEIKDFEEATIGVYKTRLDAEAAMSLYAEGYRTSNKLHIEETSLKENDKMILDFISNLLDKIIEESKNGSQELKDKVFYAVSDAKNTLGLTDEYC